MYKYKTQLYSILIRKRISKGTEETETSSTRDMEIDLSVTMKNGL